MVDSWCSRCSRCGRIRRWGLSQYCCWTGRGAQGPRGRCSSLQAHERDRPQAESVWWLDGYMYVQASVWFLNGSLTYSPSQFGYNWGCILYRVRQLGSPVLGSSNCLHDHCRIIGSCYWWRVSRMFRITFMATNISVQLCGGEVSSRWVP